MNALDESVSHDGSDIDYEIADLERRLAEAKARRGQPASHNNTSLTPSKPLSSSLTSPTHFLLLLSDSALPLGSFAFSSGLESYLAHHQHRYHLYHSSHHHHQQQRPGGSVGASASFTSFLPLSLSSYAATTLPFVLAAHRGPNGNGNGSGGTATTTTTGVCAHLAALDDLLDASIVCAVGRRASVAQGRALLSIWERSFAGVLGTSSSSSFPGEGVEGRKSGGGGGGGHGGAEQGLREFAALLRRSSAPPPAVSGGGDGHDDGWDAEPPAVAAHLAPLFGAICALAGLGLGQTAYVFLLGHVKALVSAAVRAGMFGPYQAQKTLASGTVQGLITAMIEREWTTKVEEAGQNVPVMDLWIGRHEVLYSRIFNS